MVSMLRTSQLLELLLMREAELGCIPGAEDCLSAEQSSALVPYDVSRAEERCVGSGGLAPGEAGVSDPT